MITFISGDIGGAVARARVAAMWKNVNLIGASIARQCLDAGLVDQVFAILGPVLLSDGVRFFSRPGAARVELKKLSATQAGKLMSLRFRVIK